ncbi:MAG: glycosyltransferase [Deltaproteobacteria bacterium]|nr:glycosyltransferase [Deltaproteobacteria bacterium]
MRVAFCIRKDYLTLRGGDTFQLLKTKEHLEKGYHLSIAVITDPEEIKKGAFDICHIFNLQTEEATSRFMEACKQEKIRVALSPIFWDLSYAISYELLLKYKIYGISEKKVKIAKAFLEKNNPFFPQRRFFTTAFKRYVAEMLAAADCLLPNSSEELAILAAFANLEPASLMRKSRVVVNSASDSPDGAGEQDVDTVADLPDRYVLQVARVSPEKNQYSLIKALMRDTDIPIVLVGDTADSPRYYQETRKIAERRENVLFAGMIDNERLGYYYRKASLHVLPSLRESPGLVSLEALVNGCKIVVSSEPFCPFKTYFAGIATSVNPLDINSIRAGVLGELGKERNMEEIKEQVKEKFSWKNAARETYGAYEKAV